MRKKFTAIGNRISLALLMVCLCVHAASGPTRTCDGADPIPSTPDEKFKFDPRVGILVPVEMSGERHEFAINTGLSCSIYHDSLYDQLAKGGKPQGADAPTDSPGINFFVAPELKIGQGTIELTNSKGYECAMNGERRTLFFAFGPNCKGQIGMDRLSSKVLRIDFDEEFAQIATSSIRNASAHAEPIHFRLMAPHVLMRFSSEGFQGFRIDTGKPGEFYVDTELFNTLSKSGKLKVISPSIKIKDGMTHRIGVLDSVELGPHRFHNVVVEETTNIQVLGLGFLKRFNVELDFANRMAFFLPNSHFSDPSRRDRSGIRTSIRGEQKFVLAVNPRSLGEKAGVLQGDLIMAINGVDAGPMTYDKVRDLLCEPAGTVTLKLERDKVLKEITLKLSNDPDPFPAVQKPTTNQAVFDFDP